MGKQNGIHTHNKRVLLRKGCLATPGAGKTFVLVMAISVVIPTCNRKHRVLSVLENLSRSSHPLQEIIIVDSGEDRLSPEDLAPFQQCPVFYLPAEKSVCIQRNAGIRAAAGDWIFLCDDDIEIPADYLGTLMRYIEQNPDVNAVSGHVLQKEQDQWQSNYPVTSFARLLWAWLFQQSIWGEIECKASHGLARHVKKFYQHKGNHLSKAGWPVLTNFSGNAFITPVFGLGASLVRKDCLLQSPYDEVLDRHGIGDNYGVAAGFPGFSIHVVTTAFVYHHHELGNRLDIPVSWFRRTLALDYFRQTKPALKHVKKGWLLWSLVGHSLFFLAKRNGPMLHAVLHSLRLVATNKNPYTLGRRQSQRVIEPI